MLKVYNSEEKFFVRKGCAFILGGFDGVHKGHLRLIKRAESLFLPVGILTINGGKSGGELFTLSERERIFSLENIDFVLEAEFTERFKNMPPAEFLKFILERINVKAFICGRDFRFGKNAEGDGKFIADFTALPVYIEDIALDENGEKISSGTLKKYIAEGNLSRANSLLAHDFFVSGKVLHGREDGRKMGFPTANMAYPEGKVKLQRGVYASNLFLGGKRYKGITNFGAAPTFGVERELIETYIDGFSGDLYGKELNVYPVVKIRGIEKFPSVEALKNRLEADIGILRSLNI